MKAIYAYSGWLRVYLGKSKKYSRWREVCQGTSEEECWAYLRSRRIEQGRMSLLVLELGVDPDGSANPMPPEK